MGNLDFLITTIGGNLEDLAFIGIRSYLTLNAPWTNLPVIKQIVDRVLKSILNILFAKTEFGVYVLGITQIVSEQNAAFKQAVSSGNKDQIIQAARDFIKLNSV